jgi:homoserine dehydrogenase
MSEVNHTKTVRVALAGCGVVGSELVRALHVQGPRIEMELGVRFQLERVLVRRIERPRTVAFAPGVLTADLDAFLATEADVFVEAIGGLEPAQRIARAALSKGRPFVTANKVLIAAEGEDLCSLARARGVDAHFEAAVAGGVPVVRVVREYLCRGPIRRIRGILNGTCNFVLTLLERGERLEDAIAEAQRRGFAEADPARDLDGRDAADKLAILAWLAFGVSPRSLALRRRGILPDAERLSRGASAAGGRLRLIAECEAFAECEADGEVVSASVEPIVLASESPFARTVGEENRIAIDAGWPWPIELAGPGAGGVPTAAALLADLIQATTSRAAFAPHVAFAALPTADHASNHVDLRVHAWLIGVRAGLVREARSRFADAGIAAALAGATIGDGWLITAPVSWSCIAPVLRSLEADGARPAVARLETEELRVVEEPLPLIAVAVGG